MAVVLAFGAAVAAVVGVWELLAAVERTWVAAAWRRAVTPIVRAGREGVSPTVAERRRLGVLAAAVLAAAGWLLAGLGAAVMAGVAGPAIAMSLVRARRRRFRAALAASAPVVARAFADALSAGYAVRGALDVAASGVPGAAGHELGKAARALRLGAGTETVLEQLRGRAGSAAWDAMIAGILLQRDAGGDLPALLRDLAHALEAAARQDRDAIAATAQARFTARIVLGLPVLATGLAELGSPGLLASRLADPLPAALIAMAAALQIVAVVAIRRLTRERP